MSTGKELIKELDKDTAAIEAEVQAAFADVPDEEKQDELYEASMQSFGLNRIINGKVINVHGDDVVVDIGYKSEGIVSKQEFTEGVPEVGEQIEVLLEGVEDDSGLVALSKRKADRIRGWERVIETHAEGDIVQGRVMRKIKGGLLVDIGVPVFLPASQVSIRRTGDIGRYIGQLIESKIIKIDTARRNIVVSRRRVIEEERDEMKEQLMQVIEVGQLRRGVVKNITDFGAFVDLGGIDGLLHITDMSWGRISHPSEIVAIDEEIEIMILNIDRDRERISLGLKQKEPSPWDNIDEKYPVGSKVRGQVVNVMSYGAFVKIEEGVEGLVHISEMSWTRRVAHPSEVVAIGDMVDVIVLSINQEKQEISLGMKQTEVNPWTLVQEKYPPGTVIEGRVRNMTNYGAFIEIEEGIDGLLHVSDISWTKKINHPSEILKKGEKTQAIVLSVDQDKKRVALGMKQLSPDPWLDRIPQKYVVGEMVHGRITKVTNFGVFVELEGDLEGLLHVSELTDHKIATPEEVVNVGDEVDVRILRVDPRERKIGLSMREYVPGEGPSIPEEPAQAEEAVPKEPQRGFGQTVLPAAGFTTGASAETPEAPPAPVEEAAEPEPPAAEEPPAEPAEPEVPAPEEPPQESADPPATAADEEPPAPAEPAADGEDGGEAPA